MGVREKTSADSESRNWLRRPNLWRSTKTSPRRSLRSETSQGITARTHVNLFQFTAINKRYSYGISLTPRRPKGLINRAHPMIAVRYLKLKILCLWSINLKGSKPVWSWLSCHVFGTSVEIRLGDELWGLICSKIDKSLLHWPDGTVTSVWALRHLPKQWLVNCRVADVKRAVSWWNQRSLRSHVEPHFNYFPLTCYPESWADVMGLLQCWKTGSVRLIFFWCGLTYVFETQTETTLICELGLLYKKKCWQIL